MSMDADRTSQWVGCDDLRAWLVERGFRVSAGIGQDGSNACNWYAYRPIDLPARPCENNDRQRMQLVAKPYRFPYLDPTPPFFESVELDVTGETAGLWFKLCTYALQPQDVYARLPEIEALLITAWNALAPMQPTTSAPAPDDISGADIEPGYSVDAAGTFTDQEHQ